MTDLYISSFSDVEQIQEGVGDKFGLFFQHFAMFVTGFIVGLVHGWKLTLVILAISPLLAVSGGFMSKVNTCMPLPATLHWQQISFSYLFECNTATTGFGT